MKNRFKELYAQFMTNKVLRSTIKNYYLIACMVFLAYSIVIVMSVSRAGTAQITSTEEKMLAQAEKTNDFIMRNITSAANSVFETETEGLDAMSKPYSVERSWAVSQLISQIKTRLNSIDRVYFFNLKDDCIYTGEDPVYTKETFPDDELLAMISDTSARYLLNMPHKLKYEDENYNIAEKNTIMSLYRYGVDSCMAVFVDAENFDMMVNADVSNMKQSMSILRSDGTVISATDSEQFGKNLSDDPVVKKISESPEKTGHFTRRGTMYCFRKSSTLNSIYVCAFRSSSVIVSYIWQLFIIFLFSLLLFVLYIISSIQMSTSVFRPFRELHKSIFDILDLDPDTVKSELGTERDLQLIADNLSDIKSKYESMRNTETLYSETKRNELVYNLLTGSYAYDEDELRDYNIRLVYPYNTIVLFRIDNTDKIERSGIGLIQYALANAGIELFSNSHTFPYFSTLSDEYDVVFLLNHSQQEFLPSCLNPLKKYISTQFGITVSAAFDTVKGDAESVVELYRNVKYAMQYRLVTGHDAIINYKEIIAGITSAKEYPAKLEKQLIREINSRNEEAVLRTLDEFIDTVRTLPYNYILTYSYSLIIEIGAHIRADETGSGNDILSDDIMKAETLKEIRAIMEMKCKDAMMSTVSMKSNSRQAEIANTIEKFVDENYKNQNFSIDTIATYINKSTNYTRTIFKQIKGVSISDYITQKRFAEACRLLTETNLTSQVIAQMSGLSSGSYFYTAFKRYTGYTPEQYRKSNTSS